MKHWIGGVLLCFAQTAWCASDARITLRVTDDVGNVMTNVLVKLSTLDRWVPGEAAGRSILRYEQRTTDTNGMATLTILCKNGKIGYGVYIDKRGYPFDASTYYPLWSSPTI